MESGSVRFVLSYGDTLTVPEEDLRPVYELLWDLASEKGAISTAALVMGAARLHKFAREPITLNAEQSAVLRQAVERLRAGSGVERS
jgi:hypothetical protein